MSKYKKHPIENVFVQVYSEFSKSPLPREYQQLLINIGHELYKKSTLRSHGALLGKDCGILVRALCPLHLERPGFTQYIDIVPYPFGECYIENMERVESVRGNKVLKIEDGDLIRKIFLDSGDKILIGYGVRPKL